MHMIWPDLTMQRANQAVALILTWKKHERQRPLRGQEHPQTSCLKVLKFDMCLQSCAPQKSAAYQDPVNHGLLMELSRRPCKHASSTDQLWGGEGADLVPEVLEALKPQHHAVRVCNAIAEGMHAERLGEDPQGFPHMCHVWNVGSLSRL